MPTITGTYDYRLVALSVALAMATSYAALDLAGRVTVSHRWARFVWLTGGALAMGFGIWAMHYVGMLAFQLPVRVLYHYPTVVLSLLAAIAASAVALFVVSRPRMGLANELGGSALMGGGIAGMHYIGMAAMRLPATMEFQPDRVILSIVLAVLVSLVALTLAFRVRLERKASSTKIGSAFLMGCAIPLMHYTGMWAVDFYPDNAAINFSHTISVSAISGMAIATSSFAVLALAIASSFMDRFSPPERAISNSSVSASCICRRWRKPFLRSSGRLLPMARRISPTANGLTIADSRLTKAKVPAGLWLSIPKNSTRAG